MTGAEGTGTLHQIQFLQFPILLFDTLKSLSIPDAAITAIQTDAQNIGRVSLAHLDAIQVADQVASGAAFGIFAYVSQLLGQTANTTVPAVAVEGSMSGAVGTSAEVTLLATQFLPPQVANAISHGFNSLVYSTEALGLVFALIMRMVVLGFRAALGRLTRGCRTR